MVDSKKDVYLYTKTHFKISFNDDAIISVELEDSNPVKLGSQMSLSVTFEKSVEWIPTDIEFV